MIPPKQIDSSQPNLASKFGLSLEGSTADHPIVIESGNLNGFIRRGTDEKEKESVAKPSEVTVCLHFLLWEAITRLKACFFVY